MLGLTRNGGETLCRLRGDISFSDVCIREFDGGRTTVTSIALTRSEALTHAWESLSSHVQDVTHNAAEARMMWRLRPAYLRVFYWAPKMQGWVARVRMEWTPRAGDQDAEA